MIDKAKVIRVAAMVTLAFSVQFAVVVKAQGDHYNMPILFTNVPSGDKPLPPGDPQPTVEVQGHYIEPPGGSGSPFIGSPRRGPGEHGSGGRFNDNRGDNQDVKDASAGDPCSKGGSSGSNPTSGNPIVLSTGDKVELETDFVFAGEMPLSLQRTYNHYWNYPGLFGKYWVSC